MKKWITKFVISGSLGLMFSSILISSPALCQEITDKSDLKKIFPAIPSNELVGLKVVFLAPHVGFKIPPDPNDNSLDSNRTVLIGKVGTINDIQQIQGHPFARVEVDNGNARFQTPIIDGFVVGIVPQSEMDMAQKLFKSKHLTFLGGKLDTDDGLQKYPVSVVKFCPVTVQDVVPSDDWMAPIRFVLKTASGQVGYTDLCLGATNVDSVSANENSFKQDFLITDPRSLHHWPQEIWTAIEHDKVIPGMTDDAVTMAWGMPDDFGPLTGKFALSSIYKHQDSTDYVFSPNGKVSRIVSVPTKPNINWDCDIDKTFFAFQRTGDGKQLVGIITNKSRFTYLLYLKVRFKDAEGNQVGTGEQTGEDIAPRTRWKFKIDAPSDAVAWDVVDARGNGK